MLLWPSTLSGRCPAVSSETPSQPDKQRGQWYNKQEDSLLSLTMVQQTGGQPAQPDKQRGQWSNKHEGSLPSLTNKEDNGQTNMRAAYPA